VLDLGKVAKAPSEAAARPARRRRVRARGGSRGSDPPAVILGGDITALSATRSLARAGISVQVVDRPTSRARISKCARGFVDVGTEEIQANMLSWLRSRSGGAVLLAGSDNGLELIARNRAELVELGYHPMEANDEVLLTMLDKSQTYALARERGIPAPRTVLLREQADVDAASSAFAYPIVLKPTRAHDFYNRTHTGQKVLFASDKTELQATFERLSSVGVEMLATEVIGGADDEYVSYYSYLDENGEPLFHFTKRKLRQQPVGFGIGTYHVTSNDPEVARAGLRFFQAMNLRGLGNVEFKRDSRDGELKLIECNPRMTMSNELIRRAGVNLALFSYCRALGRPTPTVDSYREDMSLWFPLKDLRAFLEYRRDGGLSFVEWSRSLLRRQQFPVASLSDPLPVLMGIPRLAQRAALRSPEARRGSPQAPHPERVPVASEPRE
jgi:D-aspartate ligase